MSSTTQKQTTAIMENYLKAIYEIGKEKKVVRVRDIATRMKVKMPTVTSMLKKLNRRELVRYEKYGFVELKQRGLDIAREMHRRHLLLMTFLTGILGVSVQVADEEACGMEHALSRATLDRLSRFIMAAPPYRNDSGKCSRRNPGLKQAVGELNPSIAPANSTKEVSVSE